MQSSGYVLKLLKTKKSDIVHEINVTEKETIVVNDDQMVAACKIIFERLKSVVELPGGASLAAATAPKFKEKYPEVKRAGVIFCGGNVSSEILKFK